MRLLTVLCTASLAAITSAYAHTVFLAPRLENESGMKYSCDDIKTPSKDETVFPTSDGPVVVINGHTELLVGVVQTMRYNPAGDHFTIQLVPTLRLAPASDCYFSLMDALPVLQSFGLTEHELDGKHATIRVSNGSHVAGGDGLYSCVDITFITAPLSTQKREALCQNGADIMATMLGNGRRISENGSVLGGDSTAVKISSPDISNDASDIHIATLTIVYVYCATILVLFMGCSKVDAGLVLTLMTFACLIGLLAILLGWGIILGSKILLAWERRAWGVE